MLDPKIGNEISDNNLDQILIFNCTKHSLILISALAPSHLILALNPFNYNIQDPSTQSCTPQNF